MGKRGGTSVRRSSATMARRRTVEYSYGTAVRQIVPEYEERYQRKRRIAKYKRRQAIKRRQQREAMIDLPYLLMLTIATIAALIICCSYVCVQSDITRSLHDISVLENNLEELRNDNDMLETSIHCNIDLDHIYDVAVNELGMVSVHPDQILHYKKIESEYVRQTDDIPVPEKKK